MGNTLLAIALKPLLLLALFVLTWWIRKWLWRAIPAGRIRTALYANRTPSFSLTIAVFFAVVVLGAIWAGLTY